jgi:ornithine--oxo-acid transaminase
LLRAGILTKNTNRNTIRFAPPFIIEAAQIEWAADQVNEVLATIAEEIAAPLVSR